MSEDTTVSFSLEVNVEKAYENVRRLQMVIFRALGLLRRLGLPENIDNAIAKVQRLISVMNQARLTAIALQAASGPIGWAMAGIGLASTWLTSAELIEDELRGR